MISWDTLYLSCCSVVQQILCPSELPQTTTWEQVLAKAEAKRNGIALREGFATCCGCCDCCWRWNHSTSPSAATCEQHGCAEPAPGGVSALTIGYSHTFCWYFPVDGKPAVLRSPGSFVSHPVLPHWHQSSTVTGVSYL